MAAEEEGEAWWGSLRRRRREPREPEVEEEELQRRQVQPWELQPWGRRLWERMHRQLERREAVNNDLESRVHVHFTSDFDLDELHPRINSGSIFDEKFFDDA